MDRGARGEKGEEGRERRNRCKKIVDAKMRFAKTGPGFPCAAHANWFTRVPGRNAARLRARVHVYRLKRPRSCVYRLKGPVGVCDCVCVNA